jgi:double-stranded uracil-DNA glycosylase
VADADARTRAVYQERAGEWHTRRGPRREDSQEFGRALGTQDRPVVDLGCGPGWHLPDLPAGTVALDAVQAMLDLVPEHAPDAPRLRASLAALPFGRGALGAAWANKSYVHLDRRELPLAWWDLHRALRVGAPARLELFEGDADQVRFDDDDFAGRSFSLWPEDLLRHVLTGAGFAVELVTRPVGGEDHLSVWIRAERTLADTVAPDMRLLLVGLNPSLRAADAGVGFVTPGNRAWPALLASGLATTDRDPLELLTRHRIGMTDLVKRATPRADELAPAEYRAGLERLHALCAWLRPGAVCVVGLSGWRAAVDRRAVVGVQPERLGGRPVYLMPNPSGLNTHVTVTDLAAHFRAAAQLADQSAQLADQSAQLADQSAELADGRGDD